MRSLIRFCNCAALAISFVHAPFVNAQEPVQGLALSRDTEVLAIVTGIRPLANTERIELAMDRICRTDVIHPDCPRDLKATAFKGRLPGAVWVQAKAVINADEQMGKQHSSLLKSTFVYVQRPVTVGDSIVMLVQLLRRVEGAPRGMQYFDVVLRGDSTHMNVIRTTRRTGSPFQ